MLKNIFGISKDENFMRDYDYDYYVHKKKKDEKKTSNNVIVLQCWCVKIKIQSQCKRKEYLCPNDSYKSTLHFCLLVIHLSQMSLGVPFSFY